jgi:hypothetical protein
MGLNGIDYKIKDIYDMCKKKIMFKYFILIPIFLVLNIFLLNGQSVNSKGKLGQPVEIKNADSLVGVRIADEGEIRRYEDMFGSSREILFCDAAKQFIILAATASIYRVMLKSLRRNAAPFATHFLQW